MPTWVFLLAIKKAPPGERRRPGGVCNQGYEGENEQDLKIEEAPVAGCYSPTIFDACVLQYCAV